MNDNFQNFGLSMIFGIVLPLICFFVDVFFNNPIMEKSALIFLTIYSFSLIISTKQKLYAFMYAIAGLIFALKYGSISATKVFQLCSPITLTYIGLIFTYLVERYQIHYLNNEEFFCFTTKNK